MKGYTTEVEYKVYNDETGCHVSVTCGAADVDLVEIRQVESEKIVARVTMEPEQARLVYEALGKYLAQMEVTS